MIRRAYEVLAAVSAVLLACLSAAALAVPAGLPPVALAVPAAAVAFVLGGRPVDGRAAALVPVAAGAGLWAGALTPAHPVATAAASVAAAAGPLWARRLGPAAASLGRAVVPALITALIVSRTTVAAPWWALCGWGTVASAAALCWAATARRLAPAPLRPAPAPRGRGGSSLTDRLALRTGLSLAAAFAAGHLLFPRHWQWTVLSALVVTLGTVSRGDLALKGLERAAGAMLGTALASALAVTLHPQGALRAATLLLVLAAATAARDSGYLLYAACTTTVMSLLTPQPGESPGHLLLIRLRALALGAALAVAIGWFLLPVRTRDVLRARVVRALGALAAVLAAHRDGDDTAGPLARLEAAVGAARASGRPLRLRGRLPRRRTAPPDDPVDALLSCLAPLRALAALPEPVPGEDRTAARVAAVRRGLAAPGGPPPTAPSPAADPPLADLDAAVDRLARALRPPPP